VRCWGENFFGQIGVGTTTDMLRPAVVPSFTLNIDPLVSVKGRGRVATVDILAICDGQHLHADVILMQGSVTGHGVAVGQCTGALERYPVTVAAHGPLGFSKGRGGRCEGTRPGARRDHRRPGVESAVNVVAP
jgi:hypothetical protein